MFMHEILTITSRDLCGNIVINLNNNNKKIPINVKCKNVLYKLFSFSYIIIIIIWVER